MRLVVEPNLRCAKCGASMACYPIYGAEGGPLREWKVEHPHAEACDESGNSAVISTEALLV